MATRKPSPKTSHPIQLYELEVILLSGPITKAFAKKNPSITRTIQIRSDQTLEDLHHAIFDAFDRDEAHLFEFQFGGKGPMDRNAKCYVTAVDGDGLFGDQKPAGIVSETSMSSIGLKPEEKFAYWFDFGDDWWHQINVIAIHDQVPKGKFPKLIDKVGASPPQYP